MDIVPALPLGTALRAIPGETLCGDQLGWWPSRDGIRLALADGLGHGPGAHAAATAAMLEIGASVDLPLHEVFAHCDARLNGTRGVALAVMDVRLETAQIEHASVGNIRSLVTRGQHVKRLAGTRGIVGAGFDTLSPESLNIAAGDWLILFSDGIHESAPIVGSLPEEHPSADLAERLLHQWASSRDDASLLLYRYG